MEPVTVSVLTDEPPHDGESLGCLTFDVRADHLAQTGGLWVYPASYDDLRLCQGRAAHLAESFGVDFFCVYIPASYFADGPSPATHSGVGWYPATIAESTPALRRIIGRAYARAVGMTPRDGADGEVDA